jgi:hypothetical protein
MSGQSNAIGRGTGGPSWGRVSESVQVWNNVNPLGALGSGFVSAQQAREGGTFEHTNRGNFGVWFCDRLALESHDDVTLTVVARGGSAISSWSEAETEFPVLDQCVSVWAQTWQAPADVFLWHQGESDVPDPSGWGDAFDALLVNLRAGGVISNSTALLVGGIANNSKERVEFNRTKIFPAAVRNGGVFVGAGQLTTYDGHHFTASGLAHLGRNRFFSAYRFAKLRAST